MPFAIVRTVDGHVAEMLVLATSIVAIAGR